MTLDTLPLDQPAIITRLTENFLTTKLVDMGLFVGKQVTVLFKAPFGDPIAIDVEGYTLSLRKQEAAYIEVDAL